MDHINGTEINILQQILDKQGFLIIGHIEPLKIGHVIKNLIWHDRSVRECHAVVIGKSTIKEWDEQSLKYGLPIKDISDFGVYVYKVVAE